MDRKLLFVVIPVHNRCDETRRCLDCLQKQTLDEFEVVVVDDGSTDGTQEMLMRDFPEVVRVEGDGSLFWTGATNAGIRYALGKGAELIVTLNNDVLVKDDYLARMLSAHQREPNSLICSLNLSQEEPSRLLFAGVESYSSWSAKTLKRGCVFQVYDDSCQGLLSSYCLPGRGLLIPRVAFGSVGLFDEKRFLHYAADNDFSMRAKKDGYKLLVDADNPVYSPFEPSRIETSHRLDMSYLKTFFDFRSANYIPVWVRYTWRHAPKRWYAPVELLFEAGRRLGRCFKPKG